MTRSDDYTMLQAAVDKGVMPMGVYYHDTPLVIHWQAGGGLRGPGMPAASHDSQSGWNWVHSRRSRNRYHACRTIFTGPKDEPAVIFKACQGYTIQHLGIEHANGGTGILYPMTRGWGASLNTIQHVSFFGCEQAIQAGEKKNDHNCADLYIDRCKFSRCGAALKTKNSQAVNFVLNFCNYDYCDHGLILENGGNVNITGGYTYALQKSFMRIDQGGPNVMPCTIERVRFDRSTGRGDPVHDIVDATRASSLVRVACRDCSMVGGRKDGGNRAIFRLRTGYSHPEHIIVKNFQSAMKLDLMPQGAGVTE